jgi:hypothetical protein
MTVTIDCNRLKLQLRFATFVIILIRNGRQRKEKILAFCFEHSGMGNGRGNRRKGK